MSGGYSLLVSTSRANCADTARSNPGVGGSAAKLKFSLLADNGLLAAGSAAFPEQAQKVNFLNNGNQVKQPAPSDGCDPMLSNFDHTGDDQCDAIVC